MRSASCPWAWRPACWPTGRWSRRRPARARRLPGRPPPPGPSGRSGRAGLSGVFVSCSAAFLVVFAGRMIASRVRTAGPGWRGEGKGADRRPEDPAQRTLDARGEREHDDDEDHAVGGDRDAGARPAGQPVARGDVDQVGLQQDQDQAAPHRPREAAEAADHRGRQQPSPPQAALTTKARIFSRATFRPASAAATSSSRTARQFRPILLADRLASRISAISATRQVSQASQRVGGNVAGRNEGLVTVTTRPWSPPNRPGNWSATVGSATASISVAPARYGPRSLAAATPTSPPTAAVNAVAAANTAGSGQPWCSRSSAHR